MAAPHGNQFWKFRKKHNQENLFKSPETLLQSAYKYFDWCDNHTWFRQEAVKSGQGMGTIISVPVVRPYSISGLCVYLGCSREYFNKIKSSGDEGFRNVIERIEGIIETQQFEGASLGVFSNSVVGRKTSRDDEEKAVDDGLKLKIEVINEKTKKELEKLKENLKK